MITGALAIAGALLLALYAGVVVGRGAEPALLACGAGLALLLIGLGTGLASLIGWSAGVLGAAYVGALIARSAPIDAAAPAVAALLPAVAELGFWSLQCRVPSDDAADMHRRRGVAIAAEAALAAIVATVCVLAASVGAGGGAAAVVAIAALLLVLVAIGALAWGVRQGRVPPPVGGGDTAP